MEQLSVTLIDVGWGDSILIESNADGERRFALVDCNDYEKERSSLLFVKRFLHRQEIDFRSQPRTFEWVLLTHGHADHARGMKRMLSAFGTNRFWYPKSVASTTYGNLLQYANRSSKVAHHQAVDSSRDLTAGVDFGSVTLEALWPDEDQIDDNENNNSVVLALTLGRVTFVLTGDAEAEIWPAIAPRIPDTVKVFQIPHHAARNALFDHHGDTPWLDRLPPGTQLAMSSHIRPHGHPHPEVVERIDTDGFPSFRTDRDYHVTFTTDGTSVTVKHSH